MQIDAQILVILATRPCNPRSPCTMLLCALTLRLFHLLSRPASPFALSSFASLPLRPHLRSTRPLPSFLRFLARNVFSKQALPSSVQVVSLCHPVCEEELSPFQRRPIFRFRRATSPLPARRETRIHRRRRERTGCKGYKAGVRPRSEGSCSSAPPSTTRLYRGEKGCSTCVDLLPSCRDHPLLRFSPFSSLSHSHSFRSCLSSHSFSRSLKFVGDRKGEVCVFVCVCVSGFFLTSERKYLIWFVFSVRLQIEAQKYRLRSVPSLFSVEALRPRKQIR